MPQDNIDTKMLWQKFSDQLRGFIRSRVSDKQEAEDVLQDIFIRIHKGIDGLRHKGRVQSWVFGIARRALVDYYRKSGRDREHSSHEDIAGEYVEDPVMDLNDFEGPHDVHEEVMSWLIPMIDELPQKYAVPLRMADIKGVRQKEIADELGLSLSGAKSRVQRARQKLGEVLAACCQVEFGEEGRAVAYHKIKDENGESNCEDC